MKKSIVDSLAFFMLLLQTHDAIDVESKITDFFLCQESSIDCNSNQVTLCSVVSVVIISINDELFSVFSTGSNILEILDILVVSQEIITMDTLEMLDFLLSESFGICYLSLDLFRILD